MAGIDSYTKLLLHCDGTDGSTSFPDSSGNSHAVTANGSCEVDTAQQKFGTASALFTAHADYLSVADSADWDLGSGDFTIDCWLRLNSASPSTTICSRVSSGSSYFYLSWEGGNLRFRDYGGSIDFSRTITETTGSWFHFAVVRNGNDFMMFIDGTQQGTTYTSSASMIDRSVALEIGRMSQNGAYYLDGWIDEFRWSKGIARWTTDFTPPTEAYSVDDEEWNGEETLNLSEEWTVQTNPQQRNDDETLELSEEWTIQTNPQQSSESETLELSESWNLSTVEYSQNISKIISYNPLIYVTNTNPAKIVEVDISSPASPVKTVYTITGCAYAKDVVFNDTNDYFYVICANGKVAKIDSTNLNNQSVIDTGETDIFGLIDSIDDFFRVYASTDNSSGEIVMIDESEIKKINTDIRFIERITKIISTRIDTILGKLVNLDIRFKAQISTLLSTDIRWVKYSYATVSQNPTDYTDIVVKINGTDLCPLNDVDLKSIVITHTVEEKSTAVFKLNRRHDKLDYDNQGNSSQITNNNAVIIQINGHTEFSGNVSNIAVESETESVIVTALMATPSILKNSVSIPLSSVAEDINLYHCLMSNINIHKPVLDTKAVIINSEGIYWTGNKWSGDINDAQEFASFTSAQSYIDSNFSDYTSQEVYPVNHDQATEYYNGIQVNLGTEIEQNVIRLQWLGTQSTLAQNIEDGEFNPTQNWSYFWFAKFTNFITNRVQATLSYLGTSLGSLSSDSWTLDGCSYKKQKKLADTETDLGFYYKGSAPYKLISAKNGRKITKYYWDDKDDGLYLVKDEGYNYEDYAKEVANVEYEKLKNINGDILPVTSADITVSVDGYYYYTIKLLSKINITNTTTSGIYSGSNGFPVGVKSITIDTNTMTVNMTCDNQKSLYELQEDEEDYPDVNDDKYTTEEEEAKYYSKFDPNTWSYPV